MFFRGLFFLDNYCIFIAWGIGIGSLPSAPLERRRVKDRQPAY
jgi:hypothetical protein